MILNHIRGGRIIVGFFFLFIFCEVLCLLIAKLAELVQVRFCQQGDIGPGRQYYGPYIFMYIPAVIHD